MVTGAKRGSQYTTRWVSTLDAAMDRLASARHLLVDNDIEEAFTDLESAKSGVERIMGDIDRELKAKE